MKKMILLLLVAALLLSGCTMRTVDQLYCPPKRSEEYDTLQKTFDGTLNGQVYCAPLAGENRQVLQEADLDGDGQPEYLLFVKGNDEKPLQILIFSREGECYLHVETIAGFGSAFDQIEYVQMDDYPGLELVVGRQVSEQVLRSVSVYTFRDGQAEQLMTTNYTRFLTCDLNRDGLSELLVLRPGATDADKGVAELYSVEQGIMERSREVNLSEPVEHLKRIITGNLHGGTPAVFVASAVGENAIITDVYAVVDGTFANVSFSNESGTSVKTLRNYYVYADDIDSDGEVELPDLITMNPVNEARSTDQQYLIRWYAMDPAGMEIDKKFTYHNYVDGWYLELDSQWASRLSVERAGGNYVFYLWDENFTQATKILTIFALTGQDREDQAVADNRFILYRSESVLYAAYLEVASASVGMSQENLINSFHLIYRAWKTGET